MATAVSSRMLSSSSRGFDHWRREVASVTKDSSNLQAPDEQESRGDVLYQVAKQFRREDSRSCAEHTRKHRMSRTTVLASDTSEPGHLKCGSSTRCIRMDAATSASSVTCAPHEAFEFKQFAPSKRDGHISRRNESLRAPGVTDHACGYCPRHGSHNFST